MTITWLVAGVVLGLSIWKFLKSRLQKKEAEIKIKDKVAICPACNSNLCIVGRYLRTNDGKGILVFKCAGQVDSRKPGRKSTCNRRSRWDFNVDPPRQS